MVSALANIISQYRGPADRVWCMAHIVNLVVQITLRQFDAPKKKKNDSDNVEVAEDLDIEERDAGDGDGEDDVVDGIDDIETAMEVEMAKVTEHVKPVKDILSKVRSHPYSSFVLINPTSVHVIPFCPNPLPSWPPYVHLPCELCHILIHTLPHSFAGWRIASRNPPHSPSLDGRRL